MLRQIYWLNFLAIVSIQLACNNSHEDSANNKGTSPQKVLITDPAALTKDYMTWYNYAYYNVRLSQDFIGLDMDSVQTDKAAFLQKLMTDNVLAYQAGVSGNKPVYKLFRMNTNDESIIATSRQMAYTANEQLKMEGKPVPDFSFTDLQGNRYSKSSVKGKIVVFKCWFIHCVACVKEFPQLNKLVESYRGRKDILFVSLAFDAANDLKTFLATREFKYATVPEMKEFMNRRLHITEYPTHILVDRDGRIKKVVNRAEDLLPFLEQEAAAGQ